MQTTTSPAIDPKAFRAALGSFATGVTVITTVSRTGEPVGLTANSFNSVSLDPPMVLWSLAKKAFSLPDFMAAKHWAVHVLSADQESLSNQFARAGQDKFAGVEYTRSEQGVPLLSNCSARFECTGTFQYEGGDHIIFVGEVNQFQKSECAPLLFHGGKYALAALKDCDFNEYKTDDSETPSFRADMLGYMFGRARKNFLDSMRVHLDKYGLTDYEWRLVTIILAIKHLTASMFAQFNHDATLETIVKTLHSLQDKGWVTTRQENPQQEPFFLLTEKGMQDSISLLATAKAHEEYLMEKMGYMDATLLKHLLQKFIKHTESTSPNLWSRPPISP